MVKLTESARRFLRNLLQQGKSKAIEDGTNETAVDELVVRMAPISSSDASGSQMGLKLAVERPHRGDEVLVEQGEPLLAVHPVLGELIEGVTLDAVETPDGGRLQIKREEPEAA